MYFEDRSTAKSYCPVNLFSLLLVTSLRNVDFFYFQYGFRSHQLTADLQTVQSDRIAKVFSGATRAVAFGILIFFTNVSLMEFQVRYLALIRFFSIIEGIKWFWMSSLHKNIQSMLIILNAPFLILHFPTIH